MICKFNLLAPWSGYGAIQGVLNKSSDAPMVYRVLVPWLIGRNKSLWKYLLIQTSLIYISLVSIYTAWGLSIVGITGILITMTFWYDYWDWTLEITGLTLALVSFPLAILGVLLLALSRETAPLVGLVYYLHFKDLTGGLLISLTGILVLLIVRKIQGKHKLYCDRWIYKVNYQLLRNGDVKAWLSIGLCIMAILSISLSRLDTLVVIPIIIAGWLLAKGNETRVFVSVIPYAALYLSGLIK